MVAIFEKGAYNKGMKYKNKSEKSMKNLKLIIERKRLIQTEFDNSEASQINFDKAVEELMKENIPFKIVHKRMISDYAKKIYFIYSVILDSFLAFLFILALFNAEKILNLLGY